MLSSSYLSYSVDKRGFQGQVVPIRSARSPTSNSKLSTFGVELRAICRVKSKKLMADEIFPRRKASWDLGCPLLVFVNLTSAPVVASQRSSSQPLLINLKPLVARTATATKASGALGHPDHHGALLCVHCLHLTVTLPPTGTTALRAAEVPPLQRIIGELTLVTGS